MGIISALATLPLRQPDDPVCGSIARALKHLSVYRLLEVRQRLLGEFDLNVSSVEMMLNIIDGQLILREIAGEEHWR